MGQVNSGTKKREFFTQFYRYGFVGVLSNSLGYLVFLCITVLGIDPIKAMSFLYVVGASISFLGNGFWTFAHKAPLRGAVLKFFLAHVSGYCLNLSLLYLFSNRLGYSYRIVQAVAVLAVACFLFLIFKYFVFVKKESLLGG